MSHSLSKLLLVAIMLWLMVQWVKILNWRRRDE